MHGRSSSNLYSQIERSDFFSAEKKCTGDYADYVKLFKIAKRKKAVELVVIYIGWWEKAKSRSYSFNRKTKIFSSINLSNKIKFILIQTG